MGKFKVTFKWSDSVYCTNIAIGDAEKIKADYESKYEWVSISTASDYELADAKRRGMPIITIE